MEKENPFESPKITQHDPSVKMLLWSAVTVIGTAIFGALVGGGIGFTIGNLFPQYYQTVFRGPMGTAPVDPIAMGVGQGVTQGFVGGIVVGLILVALFYWYTTRLIAISKNQSRVSQ